MIIATLVVLVVLLGFAVVMGVARDPGPTAIDVALGYAIAVGNRDFDAAYRLSDEEVMRGRNRADWVDDQRSEAGLEFTAEHVRVRASREVGTGAEVELTLGSGLQGVVELVQRQRVWVVRSWTVAPVVEPRA
ncbi:MAG: hypothetical protein JJE46_02040 [Acidimicrobiia bacterium]|nr:hypothetical protein [Acidimicrobiia bacterium]